MRREAIPPLRGGAVQALPNIQTTLRDHPHPASRPMTLGHFTSWRADDRGYYSRHMHLLYIIHVVYETYDTHERDTTVGHIFGARAGGFPIFFLKKSYVFICFIDIASWNCWNYIVFGRISICARGGRAHVHFVSFFARDDGPGTCATVVAEVRKAWKSCSQKPFSQKCLKSGGFPRNPQERAGWHFDNFFLKNHWVFDVFMLKSLRNLRFWKDFVLRARMCTSSHFLQGILEIWLC